MADEDKTKTEEHDATSDNLTERLKEIINEGNVQRVIVRSKDGKDLINMPLTIGVIGVAMAPLLMAVAAIVGVSQDYKIVVERRED